MPDRWDEMRKALSALLTVCVAEQKALVALDSDAVALLETQKANVVKKVARIYTDMGKPEGQAPPDVLAMTDRAQRINAANRRMLILTLQCIDGIMGQSGPGKKKAYGPGADQPAACRLMDLRV
ncbi:MAG: flagellar protein FlgN [Armatimonadetes bacterium]|nr:flagellar protein FlgN [Armatimonadota bacterium]